MWCIVDIGVGGDVCVDVCFGIWCCCWLLSLHLMRVVCINDRVCDDDDVTVVHAFMLTLALVLGYVLLVMLNLLVVLALTVFVTLPVVLLPFLF